MATIETDAAKREAWLRQMAAQEDPAASMSLGGLYESQGEPADVRAVHVGSGLRLTARADDGAGVLADLVLRILASGCNLESARMVSTDGSSLVAMSIVGDRAHILALKELVERGRLIPHGRPRQPARKVFLGGSTEQQLLTLDAPSDEVIGRVFAAIALTDIPLAIADVARHSMSGTMHVGGRLLLEGGSGSRWDSEFKRLDAMLGAMAGPGWHLTWSFGKLPGLKGSA